jgi:hypothetical protein
VILNNTVVYEVLRKGITNVILFLVSFFGGNIEKN